MLRASYRVVAFDNRGAGRSTQVDEPVTTLEDPICSLTATDWLSGGLADVETEIFHDSSHFFLMEEPERFMAALSSWLDARTGRAPS